MPPPANNDLDFTDKVIIAIIACLIISSCIILSGALFMVLWNITIPDVFHGPRITYLQATGISMLIGIVGSAFKSTKAG